MIPQSQTVSAGLASVLLVAPACASNDAGHGAECRDISKGAIPQPAGTHVCQWTNSEINRAEADGFVVYQYEWVEAKPSPFGERHLAEIACQIPKVANAIFVEPSGDSALDEQRHLAVVQAMAQYGVEIPPERVIFGHSQAEGLRGYEAGRVGNQLISGKQGPGRGRHLGRERELADLETASAARTKARPADLAAAILAESWCLPVADWAATRASYDSVFDSRRIFGRRTFPCGG